MECKNTSLRGIFYLFLILFLALTVNAADANNPNELDYKPGELIVRFAPKANGQQRTKSERNTILASFNGGSVKHSFKRVPGLTVVKLPEKTKVKDKIKAFKNKNGILYAEPNYTIDIKLFDENEFPPDTFNGEKLLEGAEIETY